MKDFFTCLTPGHASQPIKIVPCYTVGEGGRETREGERERERQGRERERERDKGGRETRDNSNITSKFSIHSYLLKL